MVSDRVSDSPHSLWLTSEDAVWLLGQIPQPIGIRRLRLLLLNTCVAPSPTGGVEPEPILAAARQVAGLGGDEAQWQQTHALAVGVLSRAREVSAYGWHDDVCASQAEYIDQFLAFHLPAIELATRPALTTGEAERLIAAAPPKLAARAIRDLFANPFRPVPLDPRWQTADVLALARGVDEESGFDRMPILADALQDAGCDNEDLLNHCRGSGPHAGGCWVIDLLLGRE